MAKRLTGMFPKHSTYVEPFAGGASVFFHKPLAQRNVLSDMDPWVIDLYKDVQKGKLSDCEGGIVASKSLFGRSQKKKTACHKVALSAMSFHGNRKSYFLPASGKEGRAIYQSKLKNQQCYSAKLKKAVVKKADFASVMKQYDSPSTLHYLDPPWPMDYSDMYFGNTKPGRGKSKNKKAFGGAMDPAHVRKVCDKMKGTVIVHYNWTPALAKVFSGPGWTVKKISASTHISGKGNVSKPNLLAIKKARR
jgi:site-specific DNA-adenine methylase